MAAMSQPQKKLAAYLTQLSEMQATKMDRRFIAKKADILSSPEFHGHYGHGPATHFLASK